MGEKAETRAVFLRAELYARIKARAKATGFGSIDEYVSFVLGEVLKGEELAFSREEEEEVQRRLKGLGYLD